MATHELTFKANVDMSTANQQIQTAARGFNIGMVRQATNLFGQQLETLANELGAIELADSFSEVTKAATDAMTVFRSVGGGPVGVALAGFSAILNTIINDLKNYDALLKNAASDFSSIQSRQSQRNLDESNARLINTYIESDAQSRSETRATYQAGYQEQLDIRNELEAAILEAAEKVRTGEVTDTREYETYVEDLKSKLSEIDQTISTMESVISQLDAIDEQIFQEEVKRKEEELKLEVELQQAAEKKAEKERAAAIAEVDRFNSILASFDESQRVDTFREKLQAGDTTTLERVRNLSENARQQIEVLRESGGQSNELAEAIRQFNLYSGLEKNYKEPEETKEKEDTSFAGVFEKMSDLAAIGGSVAGESTLSQQDQLQIDRQNMIRDIRDYVNSLKTTITEE